MQILLKTVTGEKIQSEAKDARDAGRQAIDWIEAVYGRGIKGDVQGACEIYRLEPYGAVYQTTIVMGPPSRMRGASWQNHVDQESAAAE